MSRKSRDFPDEFDKLSDAANLSDSELEALLAGAGGVSDPDSTQSLEAAEPGTRVRGVVVDCRGGEVLVEVDGKTHGVIEETDFSDGPPTIGSTIEATLIGYDKDRDLAVLSSSGAQREVLWEQVRPGSIVVGRVTGTNKGGLILDIKGIRAFLPLSQIELQRVESLEPYLGRELRCEVMSVERSRQELVLSRRFILEQEAADLRGKALARLGEGEVLRGTVTRVNEHGAFIDLGGIEGLLHRSKLSAHSKTFGSAPPKVGERLEVEVVRVDRELGRVALDMKRVSPSATKELLASYREGDEVTGWVTRVTATGVFLSVEEGLEGFIPKSNLDDSSQLTRGSIVRARITRVDLENEKIEMRPVED